MTLQIFYLNSGENHSSAKGPALVLPPEEVGVSIISLVSFLTCLITFSFASAKADLEVGATSDHSYSFATR